MKFYTRGKMLYIDTKVGNKRIRQSTGLQDSAPNRKYCLSNKEQILHNVAQPKNSKTEKSQIRQRQRSFIHSQKLLSSVLQDMLKETRGLKLSTQEAYKARFNVVHRALCGESDRAVQDISREHIRGFYDYCLQQAYSKTQIQALCQILRRILNYCVEREYISKSPFYSQRISTAKEKREICPLSLEDIGQILTNCHNTRFKTYLTTAFFTGMRCGEIYALKWENVDFANNEIHICATLTQKGSYQSPKTKSSKRVIDMLPAVKKALLAYKERAKDTQDSQFIFVENAKRNIREDRGRWYALLAKCGLQKRVLYNTRHSFASIMLSKGQNPLWVGCKMLGHKDVSITFANYARYIEDKERRATFLDGFMENLEKTGGK